MGNVNNENQSSEELERKKLIEEVKVLKRDNRISGVVLVITLATSLFSAYVSYDSEKQKMSHDEIKLFQELSKEYYDLDDKDASGFLEEKFVITSRMIMLLDEQKEDTLLYSHIETIYKNSRDGFETAKNMVKALEARKMATSSTAPLVDSAVTQKEEALKEAKEEYQNIANNNEQSVQEKKHELAVQIENLQQQIKEKEEIIFDSSHTAVDSNSYYTKKSLELNKKIYQKAGKEIEEEGSVILDKIHWFKEGYYVALPLDEAEYAVWLDKLDKKKEYIEVSLWKKNPETDLLEPIADSKKSMHLSQKVNWTSNGYKIEFKFLELERAGYTKSKAAFFDVKVNKVKPELTRPILIPRKH